MNTINTKELASLLAIAEKAIELHQSEPAVKQARAVLRAATREAKRAHGNLQEIVAQDSPEWQAILEVTASEGAAFEEAKQARQKAARRLNTAVSKHLREVGAA